MKTIQVVSWLTLAFLLLLAFGCIKPPDYPIEPRITYEGVNRTSIHQGTPGAPLDTLVVQFSFTDGDGDLSLDNDTIYNIFLTDSRDGIVQEKRFPAFPVEGTGNGIRGEVTIKIPNFLFGICCIYNQEVCAVNSRLPVDTFSYSIQIQDRAGHMSNKVQTDQISIICR